MLSLSGLHAFPLMATLAGLAPIPAAVAPTDAHSPTARQGERSSADEAAEVFCHPLGLALVLGWFPQDPGSFLPVYPSDPGDPKGSGDPPVSGDPPISGNKPPPPVNSTPEPATLISGMIGAGLIGLAGWRRRRRR